MRAAVVAMGAGLVLALLSPSAWSASTKKAGTPESRPAASGPESAPAPESLPLADDGDEDDEFLDYDPFADPFGDEGDAGADDEMELADDGAGALDGGAGGLSELEKILAGADMEVVEEKKEKAPARALFVGKAKWWTGFDTGWENRREDILDTRLIVSADLDYRLEKLRVHIGARYKWAYRTNRVGDEDHVRFDSDLRLTEAWALYPVLGVELTLGMQSIRFGAADLFSPTDFVNPIDMTEGIATDDLPRLPVFALKARYHLAGFDFYAVVIPFHTAPRIDFIGSDYALLGPASIPPMPPDMGDILESNIDNSVEPNFNRALLATELPDESPKNIQFLGRIAGSHGGFDYGVTYGYVFNGMPSFRIDPRLLDALALTDSKDPIEQALGLLLLSQLLGADANGDTTLFRSSFAREHVFATDVVTNLGPFTVKAEASLIPKRELPVGNLSDGTIGVTNRAVVNATLGADYTKGDDLLITLELGLTDVRGDPIKSDISFFAADSLRLGGLVRWTLLDGDLSLQLFGYVDFFQLDYLLAPSIRYSFNDHFSISSGAAILGGPEDSAGGYFGENDLVYVEMEAAF